MPNATIDQTLFKGEYDTQEARLLKLTEQGKEVLGLIEVQITFLSRGPVTIQQFGGSRYGHTISVTAPSGESVSARFAARKENFGSASARIYMDRSPGFKATTYNPSKKEGQFKPKQIAEAMLERLYAAVAHAKRRREEMHISNANRAAQKKELAPLKQYNDGDEDLGHLQYFKAYKGLVADVTVRRRPDGTYTAEVHQFTLPNAEAVITFVQQLVKPQ